MPMLSMPDFHSESVCNLNVFLKHPDAKVRVLFFSATEITKATRLNSHAISPPAEKHCIPKRNRRNSAFAVPKSYYNF